MRNRLVNFLLFVFVFFIALPSYASIEELNGYFEIRDTIKLMNDEMKKGLESQNLPSLFDENEIEFKLESFISFMKNRVSIYAASDSKLKFHYVKKLNSLLDETSNLFHEARPLIKAKREAKNNKQESVIPPISYSTITHPYFDSIDFRTLASREPINGDYTVINPIPVETKKKSEKEKAEEKQEKANEKPVVAKKEEKQQVKPAETKVEKPIETVAKPSVEDKKTEPAKQEPIKKETVVATEKPKEETKETNKVIMPVTQPTGEGYMRPLAIMIENHNQARPQSGLYAAAIVYEMPVEGGITRFMGLYTKLPGLIGPVRSCREYFVDRALEVDALYVHCGGSPMGYAYLAKSKIRSIDEIKNSPPFFRDKIRKAPHNLYGKGESIYKYMSKRTDMRVKTQPVPLSYGIRGELGKEAGDYLRINYHGNYTLVIKYENGVYHRYMNNILHLDRETKKPLDASAVVLQVASMRTVDAIGRQEISFIGSGTAWILEKGKRTKVTWHKAGPRNKTVYIDENGVEYLFPENGQVWVQVVSPSHKTFFEPVKESKEKAKSEVKTEVKNKSKAKNTKKG